MDHGFLVMMLQSLAALAAVLGLFALMVWGMRRLQLPMNKGAERHLQIVQRLAIDHRTSLIEVRHGEQHFLLASSPAGLVTISAGDAMPAAARAETVKNPPTVSGIDV